MNIQQQSFSAKGDQPEWEDSFYVINKGYNNCIAILIDGMGGYLKGEVASNIVCSALVSSLDKNHPSIVPTEILREAINKANNELRAVSKKHHCKMGVACSILWLYQGSAFIVSIGDVRICQIKNTGICQLTTEHRSSSLENNIFLTKSLSGNTLSNPIPINTYPYDAGNQFILCTDGFYRDFNIEALKKYINMKQYIYDNFTDNATLIKLKIS